MDRFDAMRAFVRVVDTRGFTKAAEALNLNTGTVSRMVQILEEQTNVRLLNRTTRSVSPTPEGQTYYEACVRVLEQVDSMNEEAMSAAQSPEGRIKVGMPAIFARGLVIPALPSLLDAYPGLDIELAISDEQFSLAQEAMDCTVRIGPIRESRVVAKEVARMSHALCAAPSYLRRKGLPRTVAELDDHHAVALNHGDRNTQKPWEPAGVITAVSTKSRIIVDDAEAMISCAVSGLGIVSAYRLALWPYIEKGLLAEIPIDCGLVDAPVSIVFYPSRHLPSKIRLFIDWLGEVLAEGVRIAEAGCDMAAPAVMAPGTRQFSRSVSA